MRDSEGGRGSVLLSSWNGRDCAVLPGSVSHVQRAGDVGRGRGSLSSQLLFFFILFLLSSRFGSSSGLFLFHKPVSEIVFLRYSDRLFVWWRWKGRWAYNRVRCEEFRDNT